MPPATDSPNSVITIRKCGYNNVVYWPQWAASSGKYPSQLPVNQISHILYAFAAVNATGNATLSNVYADLQAPVDGQNGTIAALRKLKSRNSKLKLILSVGGGDSLSDNFPQVAATTASRKQFVDSLYDLVQFQGFDGLDIDWEYPQSATDGANYLLLMQSIRQRLPSPRYSLSTALAAGSWALGSLDLTSVAATLDWINIMAYDFSGSWDPLVGNQAQLYAPQKPAESSQTVSGDSAVQYYISKGVPRNKLVLGAPLYGRSFLNSSGFGTTYNGTGVFPYADLPRPNSTEYTDNQTVSAYCNGGDGGIVSYDNVATIRSKAVYSVRNGLAGLMFWAGQQDKVGSGSLISTSYATMNPACLSLS